MAFRPPKGVPCSNSRSPFGRSESRDEAKPGFLEVDLVAHCGGRLQGGCLYTLTLTDVAAFCVREQITFTRGRPHEKRDQCFVEQKNGVVVRQVVGHGRLIGEHAYWQLDELYRALHWYVNCFQPSMRLAIPPPTNQRRRPRWGLLTSLHAQQSWSCRKQANQVIFTLNSSNVRVRCIG